MFIHEIGFRGALLERGFWLYVWRVRQDSREALYVGRTGDSSSRFAASPFSRLSQHLDLRPKASANMLLRNLQTRGAYPSTTWTWCSRPSSDRGTNASPGSRVPSRLTRDTPRQTPFGFSTAIR